MKNGSFLFNSRGRLRSGWRFSVFLLSYIFFSFIFGEIAAAFAALSGITKDDPVFFIINSAFSIIPAIFLGWLSGKYLEDLPFRALGASFTNGWWKDVIYGLLIGGLTLSFAVLIAVVFVGLNFRLNLDQNVNVIVKSLAVSFIVFAVAAFFEEALFRGYMLQTFARAGLAWLAISITAVFFGLVHLSNPNAGLISTINTALAGIWFGIAYLKTRNLWFVWGLHFMWNWMQGSIFGIEVSGLTDISNAPLLKEIDRGPEWLTGSSYGIEGGVSSTTALIISTLAIYFTSLIRPTEEMLSLTSSESDKI